MESHGEYIETVSWKAAVEERLCQNIWKKDKRKTYHRKRVINKQLRRHIQEKKKPNSVYYSQRERKSNQDGLLDERTSDKYGIWEN